MATLLLLSSSWSSSSPPTHKPVVLVDREREREIYGDILNGTPKVIFSKIMKHITIRNTYIKLTLYIRLSCRSTSYKAIWFYGPRISIIIQKIARCWVPPWARWCQLKSMHPKSLKYISDHIRNFYKWCAPSAFLIDFLYVRLICLVFASGSSQRILLNILINICLPLRLTKYQFCTRILDWNKFQKAWAKSRYTDPQYYTMQCIPTFGPPKRVRLLLPLHIH